jgi:hypothetical protein
MWPIIHEDGKLVVQTICCPLVSNIYIKKMTIEMATNFSNDIYDNMGTSKKKKVQCIYRELYVASKSSSSIFEGWDTLGQLLEAPNSMQQKLTNPNVLPWEIHGS